jgi:hypothetical protein
VLNGGGEVRPRFCPERRSRAKAVIGLAANTKTALASKRQKHTALDERWLTSATRSYLGRCVDCLRYGNMVNRTAGERSQVRAMPIIEGRFDSEAELQQWVKSNVSAFLSDCIFIDGFRITTSAGKGGVPDGFALNFKSREWHIVESELLSHGVWPHIAEQLTRFVVAAQNPSSLRIVRDRALEFIMRKLQNPFAN